LGSASIIYDPAVTGESDGSLPGVGQRAQPQCPFDGPPAAGCACAGVLRDRRRAVAATRWG